MLGKHITYLVILVLFLSCNLYNNEQSDPAVPGKLVYSMRDDSGDYQLFTSNTDGSEIQQITFLEDNHQASRPSWSPDGETIVFTSTLRSTTAGASLYLINTDGSNLRPLKEEEGNPLVLSGSNPSWSPDGAKIAFDLCTNCEAGGGNYEIYVYHFDTDSVVQITDSPAKDYVPKWTTSQDRISFSSDREYYDSTDRRLDQDLYDILPNGSELRRITTDGKIGFWVNRSLNDSYFLIKNSSPIQWYSLDFFTQDTVQTFSLTSLTSEMIQNFKPIMFSPEGKFLVFVDIKNSPLYEIQFFNLETEELLGGVTIEEMNGFDWNYQ